MPSVQLSVKPPSLRQLALLKDTLDDWRSDPVRAFSGWIATATFVTQDPHTPDKKGKEREYSAATIEVYTAMFTKFNAWCDDIGAPLLQVTAAHLTRFLEEAVRPRCKDGDDAPIQRALIERNRKRHRRAYLRLLERVFARLIDLGAAIANPAAGAARSGAVRNAQDNPTRFLSAADRDGFVGYLCAPDKQDQKLKNRQEEESWVAQRDRTMALVLVGAGLKISELQAMALNCISDTGVISVRPPGARQVTPLPFARAALIAWVDTHRALKLSPAVLFPPSRAGAGRPPPGPGSRLHPATIHRRMHALLRDAGVRLPDQGERLCAQTMRNSYAAALIDDGADDTVLADRLHVTDHTAARLRRAYERSRTAGARP